VTADIAGRSSGSVSGVMNTGNQVGAALTASLTPWIGTRFGWTAAFLTAAVLCLVGAVCWLVVDPTKTLVVLPGMDSVEPSISSRGVRVNPANS
jgi:ACS family glucarate transporter-like MFS transporter